MDTKVCKAKDKAQIQQTHSRQIKKVKAENKIIPHGPYWQLLMPAELIPFCSRCYFVVIYEYL